MPPPRRRPVPTTPTTRPRVAGLRKRPGSGGAAAGAPEARDARAGGAEVTGTGTEPADTDVRDTGPDAAEPVGTEPDAAGPDDADPAGTEPAGTEPDDDEPGGTEPDDAGPDDTRPAATGPDEDERADAESAAADLRDAERGSHAPDHAPDHAPVQAPGLIEPGGGVVEDDEPTPRPRPAGRRRRTGGAVAPSVLDDGPERASSDREVEQSARAARRRGSGGDGRPSPRTGLVLPIALVVLAGLLVGLGAWFQGRAGDVRYDRALVDSSATAEVAGQVRAAVEKSFSYDFADVPATEEAANELLAGRAQCQYNAIFGPVRALAPEQKLVVTVKAVSSGVTSLVDDRATVLLFLDQVTTRTTDNQTGGGIAMMRVGARKVEGRWKVDNMEMFGQTGDQAAETARC